tara:strand:+ start:8302 stop:8880 length:579 start_codon:yes stop_codon:yes gene_type:complete
MTKDYSLEALGKFLDYTAEKGLMKRETANGRKTASNAILGVLGDEELQDLRTVNVGDVASRFANLSGSKYSPASLQVYKSRLETALKEFFSYTDNPIGYKPSVSSRSSSKASGDGKTPGSGKKTGSSRQKREVVNRPQFGAHEGHDDAGREIIFPIPIRSDLVVRIVNLPSDLTSTEAERIAAVVKALAVGK